MSRDDRTHLMYCYTLMHEALNEMCQVREKDSILTHMQNRMYAMEDTLYEYIGGAR